MTQDRTGRTAADKPVVVVGFVASALPSLGEMQADGSVIIIEEPDIVRKRQVKEHLAGSTLVRELIEWEFYLEGKADEFYLAHRDLDPAGVIPLVEYATPFAARLAERYGLPGSGYAAARTLRDKALLRQVSRAAGIANPESAQVHDPADVLAFMRAHPGPIVLKPANRQASIGTRVVHDQSEIDQAWADCLIQDEGIYSPDRPMELRMLAERFVHGDEYSVEMLIRDGEQLFVNVTGKQLFPGPRPVELAHIVPADIPAELAALLGEQTRRLIDAVGFVSGTVHCEWIVSEGTPYLVECAGRFAGDGIIELIQRAYPVRLVPALYAVLKGEELPALPERAERAGAVRFLMIEPGVVDYVHGLEEAEKAEGVFSAEVEIAPGERFDGLHSSWDRVGEVMVTGDTPADALRLAEAAVSLVQIGLRPAYGAAQRASVSP